MKVLIALLILMAVYWVGKHLYGSYQTIEKHQADSESGTPPQATPAATLPGLPASLEASLSAAQKQGAAGLRNWLATYRTFARDPRLAAIELDYVVLINHQDPAEARRIFQEVQARTPSSSPVYSRVKQLERTFQ